MKNNIKKITILSVGLLVNNTTLPADSSTAQGVRYTNTSTRVSTVGTPSTQPASTPSAHTIPTEPTKQVIPDKTSTQKQMPTAIKREYTEEEIKRSIISAHTAAFGKDNLFTGLESKNANEKVKKETEDKNKKDFLTKDLPLWSSTISYAANYVNKNAYNDATLISVLNSCLKVNQDILTIFTRFYTASPDKTIPDKKTMLEPFIKTLAIHEQELIQATDKLNAPSNDNKTWLSTLWSSTSDKKKAEAKKLLNLLSPYLIATITKIKKEYTALQ